MKEDRKVFVTVGSTLFDALVKAVTTHECLQVLQSHGYSSLVIQLGKGTFLPPKGTGEEENVKVEYLTSAPDLVDQIGTAGLVISHAGSGSIFETLRARKPLVVVVNNLLMDNHQSELAEELSERKYLFCARPETLVDTLKSMDLTSLVPYPTSDPSKLVKALTNFWVFRTHITLVVTSKCLGGCFRTGLIIARDSVKVSFEETSEDLGPGVPHLNIFFRDLLLFQERTIYFLPNSRPSSTCLCVAIMRTKHGEYFCDKEFNVVSTFIR
jgi:beta-1,4-N-acetylglucosaminyltransferase